MHDTSSVTIMRTVESKRKSGRERERERKKLSSLEERKREGVGRQIGNLGAMVVGNVQW